MPAPLTSDRRSALRAEAHKLRPVVLIGDKGLTESVVAEIDRALKAHELIKIRAGTDDREARGAWLVEICAKLEAHPVQQIGKVLVVYRANPEARKPAATPPKAKPKGKPRGKPRAKPREAEAREARRPKFKVPAEAVIGTSRRRSRTPSPRPESGPLQRRPSTSRSGLSRSAKSKKFSRA